MNTIAYSTWTEFYGACNQPTGRRNWYHAPMDREPRLIRSVTPYKNGKVRIKAGDLSFTIDAGHLNRLSYSLAS